MRNPASLIWFVFATSTFMLNNVFFSGLVIFITPTPGLELVLVPSVR